MIINGSDLFMWISTELVAYSTSYSLNIEMETRPGTNKGSGIYRKALPGMLNISGSVDGLYVFAGGYATLFGRMIDRTPVRLRFGRKDSVTGQVDTTVDFMSADFLITSLELNATDAENATYTASFVYYDGFGSVSGITVPTVITDFASLPTTTTIRMNGNVTSDGGAIVTDRGFVWNTDGNPTMADFHISEGSGTGVYSQLVTGLASGTPYFFRAYATNAAGTSYGFMSTFTTVAEAVPSYFWIAPNGSDKTGNGEFNTPWLTLAHAISQVTTGNTINLKVGTYNLTTQVVLPVGISLRGQGASTIITTSAALNPMISMLSASEGTNGNQSISSLAFDGDNVAVMGIHVRARSNVIVRDCSFIDFTDNGLRFTGLVSGSGEPTNYAVNNSVHDCTFTNCGGETYSAPNYFASAAIGFSGQSNAEAYDNHIDNTLGNYAYGINTNGIGYNRGLKIHDNTILISPKHVSTNQWQFSIELWTCRGGIEIYNNTVSGGIDFGGVSTSDVGGYGFAARINNNIIALPAIQAYDHTGVIIESDISGGVYVFNNTIKNYNYGLTMNALSGPADTMEDIYVYYNLFIETTKNSNYSGRAIASGSNGDSFSNIYLYNNTCYTYSYKASAGFHFATPGAVFNNINIRNNIFNNAYNAIRFENNTINGAQFTNNLFYQHNGAITYVNVTQSGVVEANNILAQDPLFISGVNYHLQALSPCRDAGINVGLLTDYDGVAVANPPEIGAYEYV